MRRLTSPRLMQVSSLYSMASSKVVFGVGRLSHVLPLAAFVVPGLLGHQEDVGPNGANHFLFISCRNYHQRFNVEHCCLQDSWTAHQGNAGRESHRRLRGRALTSITWQLAQLAAIDVWTDRLARRCNEGAHPSWFREEARLCLVSCVVSFGVVLHVETTYMVVLSRHAMLQSSPTHKRTPLITRNFARLLCGEPSPGRACVCQRAGWCRYDVSWRSCACACAVNQVGEHVFINLVPDVAKRLRLLVELAVFG